MMNTSFFTTPRKPRTTQPRPASKRVIKSDQSQPEQPRVWDALTIATVVGMVIVGMVAIIDLLYDGKIEPNIVALFVSVFGPLTPALILRSRGK